MSKKTFRFGDEYLLAYGRVIFTVKRYRNKPTKLIMNKRKRRDAQPWAIVMKED